MLVECVVLVWSSLYLLTYTCPVSLPHHVWVKKSFFVCFATPRVHVHPILAPVVAHIMLVECVVLVSPPLYLLTYTGLFSLPHHVCVCVETDSLFFSSRMSKAHPRAALCVYVPHK